MRSKTVDTEGMQDSDVGSIEARETQCHTIVTILQLSPLSLLEAARQRLPPMAQPVSLVPQLLPNPSLGSADWGDSQRQGSASASNEHLRCAPAQRTSKFHQ
mmetsp:Transcript_15713/g.36874  ORF Transcript_15713/g.36874 Transcript_15713/m.36874 type:complete len:102 (-) Transcript_15713:1379-1684(-)